MFALVVALAALIAFTPTTYAQTGNYTVWSSVIFQRTGDRTPDIIGDGTTAIVLTTLGQNQAYSSGAYFRNRYINAAYGNANGTNGADGNGAPLRGLQPDRIDTLQTYATTLDQTWTVQTAYAWFQGFYPPFTLGASTAISQTDLFPTDSIVDANMTGITFVPAPLNGYQYPSVHVAGGYDPNFVYLGAHLDCPAWATSAEEYTQNPQFSVTEEQFDGIYDAVGSKVLVGVVDQSAWDYYNAYAIYDWLRYQNIHNATVAEALATSVNVTTNTSFLDTLRWLADEQQYAQLGNLSAVNPYTGDAGLPNTDTGSISTLPGNMYAAKVVNVLEEAINYSAEGYFKLNLLFADYAPLVSFFALMGLPNLDSDFYGLPEFGSAAVFELFSYETSETSTMPDPSNLWVRFYFRNGTDDSNPYTAYPLFNRGPDGTDMTWPDFQNSIYKIVMGDPAEWCAVCGAANQFCTAYNLTDDSGDSTSTSTSPSGAASRDSHALNPVIAGVIGAVIALITAALIFALVMLLSGLRFHRNATTPRRRQSELGGFRGGQKMASDQDLTIPKGGAVVVGASIEQSPTSPTNGHERIGSWELKQAEAGRGLGFVTPSARPSMEQRARTPEPEGLRPVRPMEGV